MWIEFVPSEYDPKIPFEPFANPRQTLEVNVFTQRFEWSIGQRPSAIFSCRDSDVPIICADPENWVFWFQPPADELGCYSIEAAYLHSFQCPATCYPNQFCWELECPLFCQPDYRKPVNEWTMAEWTGECRVSNPGWVSVGIDSEYFSTAVVCDPGIEEVLIVTPEPMGIVMLLAGVVLLGILGLWRHRKERE